MRSLFFSLALLPRIATADELQFVEPDALLMCKGMSSTDSLFDESPIEYFSKCMQLMKVAHAGASVLWRKYQSHEDPTINEGIGICLTTFDHKLLRRKANWIEVHACLGDIHEYFAHWIVSAYVKENIDKESRLGWRVSVSLYQCEANGLAVADVRPCIDTIVSKICAETDKSPDFCPAK